MKITRRQLRKIISEAMHNEPKVGSKYELIKRTATRPGSYSPYRQAQVVGIGRGPLGKTVKVKSLVDRSASLFDIPIQAFRGQFKLIKEAIDPNADHEEAAYAIIYAEAYVTKFNQYFGHAVHERKFMTTQTMPPAILMMDATDNLEAILAAQMRGINRKIASLPEANSITKEAEQAAEDDFRDNIYTCVEQMDILINRQTPVGMSAAEALDVFGEEGGGVPFKDTAVSDVRAITALMDNDEVLTMLDSLVEMLPELNVFYSR